MANSSIAQLLAAWRAAARRWEAASDRDPTGDTGLDVIRTWLAYQEAASPAADDEFILVTDDDQRYIAATSNVTNVLGYNPAELLELRIDDVAAADVIDGVSTQWARFLEDGSQEGEFVLRCADGRLVQVAFHARVNHPVPGVHASRLRRLHAADPNATAREKVGVLI